MAHNHSYVGSIPALAPKFLNLYKGLSMPRRNHNRRDEEAQTKSGININLDLTSKNGMKIIGAGGCIMGAVLLAVFGGEQSYIAGYLTLAAVLVWID